jgi:hypothetical protein
LISESTSLLWRRTIATVIVMHAVRLGMAAWGGGQPALVLALCGVAVAASALLLRRRAHPLWMALALLALAGIHELVRAAVGNYEDQIFQTAATGAGWLAGAAVAATALAPGDPSRRREGIEAMAATGAAAGLGAAYVCAGVSKLVAANPAAWIDPDWLRIIALEHQPVGMGPARAWLFDLATASPGFALLGSAYAVAAELAAFLLPLGRRPRLVAGSLLLILHGGIWLFTDILFIAGFTFLLALHLRLARAGPTRPRAVARAGPDAARAAPASPGAGGPRRRRSPRRRRPVDAPDRAPHPRGAPARARRRRPDRASAAGASAAGQSALARARAAAMR